MIKQNVVLVLDSAKRQMTPCSPARARILRKEGKAAKFRSFPYTVILKEEKPDAVVKVSVLKADPGSKTTGIALVQEGRVIFAAELAHRGGAIKDALQSRAALRRDRKSVV